MAEKASIFGGVVFGQGIFSLRRVTFGAEFFRLFFPHVLEAAVVRIFWQFFCGLFWGVEQKKEDSGAGEDEGDIQEEWLDSFWGSGGHDFCSRC